jgi:hypothetical protein
MQPLLNKPGLEAMGEDQPLADFICALRGRKEAIGSWNAELEVLRATETIWAKPQGAKTGRAGWLRQA